MALHKPDMMRCNIAGERQQTQNPVPKPQSLVDIKHRLFTVSGTSGGGKIMSPATFLEYFLQLWLVALTTLIAYRVLTGAISLNGLFSMDGVRFSPERMQLLLVTLLMAAGYAEESLRTMKMAPIANEFVVLFAASHAAYLGGKTAGR
jgi:hypothetical protein